MPAMKKVFLLRHGQSFLNIEPGISDGNSAEVPLTKLGFAQAKAACLNIKYFLSENEKIDLIACSPFLRARLTAEPFIERNPDACFEIWPELKEFTFLSPDAVRGMTRDQRRPLCKSFWSSNNPDLLHGDGAESFRLFIARADAVIQRVRERNEKCILLITHEQFIKALLFRLKEGNDDMAQIMRKFKRTHGIKNCEIVPAGNLFQ